MQPSVSIVVPVYNAEPYLEQCLNSLVNQTLKTIEIICIDDGSVDNSGKTLDEFAKRYSNIRIISKENAGYGAALNDGIAAATGRYLGIVEPDDYVLPRMFETLYKIADKYDVDLVKGDHYEFVGKEIDEQSTYVPLARDRQYYGRIIDPREDILVFNLDMVTCAGIYSLDFIRKQGIRYNETPGASYQDIGFWHQTFYYARKVYFHDEAFYCYRQDNAASSTNSTGKALAGRAEYEYIYNILRRNRSLYDIFIGIHTFRKFNNYLYTYRRIEPKSRYDFLKLFSADFKKFQEQGEIDWSFFDPVQRFMLMQVIDEPDSFFAGDAGFPIVFATDDAYASYTGVTIQSLIDCANEEITYSINILFTHLCLSNRLSLLSLARKNIGIRLINVSDCIKNDILYARYHFSIAMYYRILIPELFPASKTVLYLDSDLIIRDDVAKLFEIDLGDNVVGAVHNLCDRNRSEYVISRLDLEPAQYFNSGVMLFNVSAFRAYNVKAKCTELISVLRDLECPDQDILNMSCAGKVKWLPAVWNVALQHAIRSAAFYDDKQAYQEYIASLDSASILHYASGRKPWLYPTDAFSYLFWEVARRTVFYEAIIYANTEQLNQRNIQKLIGQKKKMLPPIKEKMKKARAYYARHGLSRTVKRLLRINS